MKIAVVTESFLPTINGVTNSVLRILEFFDAYGHEAIVIAPESNSGPDDYLGFKVKRVPSISMKRLIPIAIPKRAIRHFIDGFSPDVIHLASPAILGTYVNNVSKEPTVGHVQRQGSVKYLVRMSQYNLSTAAAAPASITDGRVAGFSLH